MWDIIKIELGLELTSSSHLVQAVMADGAIMSNEKDLYNKYATSACFHWIDLMGRSPDSCRNSLGGTGQMQPIQGMSQNQMGFLLSSASLYAKNRVMVVIAMEMSMLKVLKLFDCFWLAERHLCWWLKWCDSILRTMMFLGREKVHPQSIQGLCLRYDNCMMLNSWCNLISQTRLITKMIELLYVSNPTAKYSCRSALPLNGEFKTSRWSVNVKPRYCWWTKSFTTKDDV